jgi:hypothetical protein
VRLEGIGQLINPVTSLGIEPATFRLEDLRYYIPLHFTKYSPCSIYFLQLLQIRLFGLFEFRTSENNNLYKNKGGSGLRRGQTELKFSTTQKNTKTEQYADRRPEPTIPVSNGHRQLERPL